MRSHYWSMIAVVAMLLSALLWQCGCHTKISGGESHEQDALVRVQYPQDGKGNVVVEVADARSSTTQPTYDAFLTEQDVGLEGSKRAGELGGLSFKQVEQRFKNSWQLGLGFLVVAFIFFRMARYYAAAGSGAAGVLCILYPQFVVWIACGILLYLAWTVYQHFSQLKRGIEKVEAKEPATEVANYLKEELDGASQRAVGIHKK